MIQLNNYPYDSASSTLQTAEPATRSSSVAWQIPARAAIESGRFMAADHAMAVQLPHGILFCQRFDIAEE